MKMGEKCVGNGPKRLKEVDVAVLVEVSLRVLLLECIDRLERDALLPAAPQPPSPAFGTQDTAERTTNQHAKSKPREADCDQRHCAVTVL